MSNDQKEYYLFHYHTLKSFKPLKIVEHTDWKGDLKVSFYSTSYDLWRPVGFLNKNVFETPQDAIPVIEKRLQKYQRVIDKLQKILSSIKEEGGVQ